MTDLDNRMGIARDDDEQNQAVTGDLFPEGREGLAVSLFRGILTEEELVSINMFLGYEATFTSTRGTLSWIDHIAAPTEMLPQLDQCRVLVKTGIRLQVVRSVFRHGHSPERAVSQQCPSRERTSEEAARSAEAIDPCWTAGCNSPEVIGCVEQALEENRAKFGYP